jgi:hypothetical protein
MHKIMDVPYLSLKSWTSPIYPKTERGSDEIGFPGNGPDRT